MNDRAQQLLVAYRADTAPSSEHEDALFDAIVHRIVTTEADAPAPERDEAEDDEAQVEQAPRRGRRVIVVPVAVATAAIAAGLLLAMSLRGQIATVVHEASPWQAPNIENAAPQWWHKVVPRALFRDEHEVESQEIAPGAALVPATPDADVTPGISEPHEAMTKTRTRNAPTPPPGAGVAGPPTDKESGDDWGAPAAPSARSTSVPGRPPTPTQAGGGLPSAPSAPATDTNNDDNPGGRGDGQGTRTPSGSDPGGGPGDPGQPRPNDPGQPDPDDPGQPDPDDPMPPPECEQEREECWATMPGPHCEEICGDNPDSCVSELEACIDNGTPPEQCEFDLEVCSEQPPMPEEMCLDEYAGCAMAAQDPWDCLDGFSACLENLGGASPESCPTITGLCIDKHPELMCDDVEMVCNALMPHELQCDADFDACTQGADHEMFEMCNESYEDCINEPYAEEPGPPDEHCFAAFDQCMVDGGPEQCEAEFSGCMSF